MSIANECDRRVGLRGNRIERMYAEVTEIEKTSPQTEGMRLICIIGCIICSWTCVEPFVNAWAGGKELEFPFTGTNENSKLFVAIYLLQCSLMFITANFCIVIFQTLMGTALNLVIKYKVIGMELARLNEKMVNDKDVYKTDLYQSIRRCVQSHHHILRIFERYREVCTYGFRYSYVGLMGATTLSRTLLSGDEPDLGTIPHLIAELSYIGFFCYILNHLEEQNDNLKDAVYAGDWAWMPKKATSALRLIMLRTTKRPHVILVKGGGPANLETFYKLLNGTCGYIIFGLVLDQAAF
uniref:Olfactory receptor 17 n=1 Tax=Adelphocoris lineolatus TaxID=236346 RepID=A0A2I4PH29_ADELI|nr:olfactory receptor 17 [Adelphocoris lineolatus]